jgi:putative ABC transport system permease protein
MWHNYLAAAIRNLFRDSAYAAINICGLALGFAAAILIGLYVRDELGYDRAYPHSNRTFRILVHINAATRLSLAVGDGRWAPALKLDYPEVEFATRLAPGYGALRQKDVEAASLIYRADTDFFRMFPPKVVAGDPDAALGQPNQVVLTRQFARQLFGREDIVGQSVQLNGPQGSKTVNVGAVIENLPSNTHFNFDVIASATDNELTRATNAYTYVRLRPGADVHKLNARMPEFVDRHLTGKIGTASKYVNLRLVALPDLHFLPASVGDMKAPSDRRTVDALIAIGLLILFVAGSNFVSMVTARAARRAIEVGVRKAVGATRGQIILQFLAECLFYAGLALGIALVAVEVVLPGYDAFLQRPIAFDYVRDATLGAAIVAAWLAVSLAAAAYPALVLSMFRPVTALKGVLSLPGGSGRLRNALVVLQFATMVGLIVATITIHRQTRFAIEDQLRVPGDQLYIMSGICFGSYRDLAERVPGVRAATCVSDSALAMDRSSAIFTLQTGRQLSLNAGRVDRAFFDMFGIAPLAGRLFDDQHGEDNVARDAAATANPSLVLNESAARVLGYAKPADALGKTRYWSRVEVSRGGNISILDAQPSQIVGIVPDFVVGSIRDAIEPTAYFIEPAMASTLMLKLDGKSIPETMRALQAAWRQSNNGRIGAFPGQFMTERINDLYADIRRQTRLFAGFSTVAIVVASLGLLGLTVFAAQRSTREIGLRKVMGASRSDILRVIGWRFVRPVLIANLVAWPVGWFFMRRWLEGFAYHVDLGPLAFLLASGLALVIALVTVTGHALLVARAKPVEALRYE